MKFSVFLLMPYSYFSMNIGVLDGSFLRSIFNGFGIPQRSKNAFGFVYDRASNSCISFAVLFIGFLLF